MTNTHRGFWVRHLMVPLFACCLLLIWLERSGADQTFQDRFFDFTTRRWPARANALVEIVLHKKLRDVIVLVGLFALGRVARAAVRGEPLRPLGATFLLASIVLGTGSVAVLKRVVNLHCPWDMRRYGGMIPDDHSGPLISTTGHGLCFPSGHAAGGFSLLALYFLGRRTNARHAAAGLAIGLGMGTVMGFSQVLRGAHYASHAVWSGIICWSICLGLHAMLGPGGVDHRP